MPVHGHYPPDGALYGDCGCSHPEEDRPNWGPNPARGPEPPAALPEARLHGVRAPMSLPPIIIAICVLLPGFVGAFMHHAADERIERRIRTLEFEMARMVADTTTQYLFRDCRGKGER